MKTRLTSVVIISLLVFSEAVASPNHDYTFRVINASDGLSDSEVRGISQAPNGLMCIRTSRSLNVYNGTLFSQYYYNYEAVPYNENTGVQQDYFDEKGRMWLKETDKLWVFDFDSGEFIYDVSNLIPGTELPTGLKTVFIDGANDYWIIDNARNLIHIDAEKKSTIAPYRNNEEAMIPIEIITAGDLYWLLYEDNVLQCWDPYNEKFVYREGGVAQLQERKNHTTFGNTVRKMIADKSGNLWILYSNALYYYDTKRHSLREFPEIVLAGSDQLTSMSIDGDGSLWLGSSKSGLRIIYLPDFSVSQLPYLSLISGDSISHNTDITSLFIDRNGGVWIATLTEGILYYHKSMSKFPLVNNRMLADNTIPDENIKCMVEDGDGAILVGTVNGLLRYRPSDGRIDIPYPELADELCTGLYRDRSDKIWLGTFQNGAFCIDRGKIRHYKYGSMPQVHISYHNSTPNLNNVRTFFEDDHGTLWISVYGGIGRFDPNTGAITLLSERFPQISKMMVVRNIHYIDDSVLLVASDNGMFRYDVEKDKIYLDFSMNVPTTRFNCTLSDSRKLLWMATFDGLFIWDPISGKTEKMDVSKGLPNNNVYGVEEDDNGDIWLSTFGSLTRIEVYGTPGAYTYKMNSFNTNDGVQSGGFFEHSVIKTADGNIYFGGTHGFNIVSPCDIIYNTATSVAQFTDIRLFGRTIEIGAKYGGRIILERSFNRTDQIILSHNQNFVSLDFAGMNYVNPSQTFFRYRLAGLEQQWTEVISDNGLGRAVYTSLRPGKYRLEVYTANNDKMWSDIPANMDIIIRPPLWWTTTAKILYTVAAMLLVWGAISLGLRRTRRKFLLEKELEARRQKEELDQMKFRFFTNISHELRTPLTLIIAPLNSVIKKIGDAQIHSQLEVVRRNAEQLLYIVNQLLDFRKLEMAGEKLKLSGTYVIPFAEEVFSSFHELAGEKMINLNFFAELSESTYLYVDRNKLQKILNNLLSNAFKFTPSGGSVTLAVKGSDGENGREMIEMSVADTGVGIGNKDMEYIFDRFYQAENQNSIPMPGTGIGLHLIKGYVEMHQGNVSVNSTEGVGTTFTIRIPADLRPESSAQAEPEVAPDSIPPEDLKIADSVRQSRKTILFVEDNSEFRNYVVKELLSMYDMVQASDGEEGEKVALKSHPDIIVSDVMMPVMDGVEMCRRLKGNIETSHIPIILLTAHHSDENKFEGYEAGADAYISKPFDFDMLLLRIQKLIDQQEKRKEQFSSAIEVNPSSITITSIDEQLIQKALECVEKNIDNPDYSVEQLSSDVNMHRMNLYRKIRSIVGQTPSEFIRTIRLKRAAQLLQQSRLPVIEIAEMVGFNTPKYFYKYFKEMFGSTPSAYANKFKKESQSHE